MNTFNFDKEELILEGNYFLKELFSIKENNKLVNLYVIAHDHIFKNPTIEIHDVDIAKIVKKKLNVEAIEFAVRTHFQDNLLTKKIQILAYILESQKAYNEIFNNFRQRFLFGIALLAYMTFRSICLLICGKYLISRYDLLR